MAVRWVFFDVGDVLFDEDAQHLYFYHSLHLAMRRNGIEVGWDDYHAAVHRCARERPASAILDAVRMFVSDSVLYQRIYREARGAYSALRKPRPYGLLLDNITAVLEDLRGEYRLGIIANQHPEILQALADYGIARFFDVVVIDEIVGVSKPDPAIFQLALERAGCAPTEAIMVGDRPDNDIAPARSLGFATIRFQRGILYSLYEPKTESERSNRVVHNASEIAPAVRELAASLNA